VETKVSQRKRRNLGGHKTGNAMSAGLQLYLKQATIKQATMQRWQRLRGSSPRAEC
jgi:hypothetical protein